MKTIVHIAQNEIEEAVEDWLRIRGHEGKKLKAAIIVELRQETSGDPRDPPYSVVNCIRAEVTEE